MFKDKGYRENIMEAAVERFTSFKESEKQCKSLLIEKSKINTKIEQKKHQIRRTMRQSIANNRVSIAAFSNFSAGSLNRGKKPTNAFDAIRELRKNLGI